MPTAMKPRSTMPMIDAGSPVIFRTASPSDRTAAFRT